jgi:hypothetical protein
MDLVTLFAIGVFGVSWFFLARTEPDEPLVRLFWRAMLFMGAGIGVLSLILRLAG